ncbi:MAG TPA: hypothetical protein PLI95_16755 [Polyangiaceae bacterium]|nr:hypothetical protein [Polyangiaceae bacterium]
MAERKKSKAAANAPMIGFFAVILGVVFLLWWMSRPPPSASSAAAKTSGSAAVAGSTLPLPITPGARPSRKLCGNDQVSQYIGKELSEGELNPADLREITTVVMAELEQAGAVSNGCVESDHVKAVVYELAAESQPAPF